MQQNYVAGFFAQNEFKLSLFKNWAEKVKNNRLDEWLENVAIAGTMFTDPTLSRIIINNEEINPKEGSVLLGWQRAGISISKLKVENYSIIELNLSGLIGLPENIAELKNLRELNISWNKLSSLPENIGKLTKLQKLKIQYNNLTSLPESIGKLVNLQELYIYGNNLTSLPESIGELVNLTYLNLSSNKLTSLPESLFDLKNLTYLSLGSNKLDSLPESITQLKLTYLDIEKNSFNSHSKQIRNWLNSVKKRGTLYE